MMSEWTGEHVLLVLFSSSVRFSLLLLLCGLKWRVCGRDAWMKDNFDLAWIYLTLLIRHSLSRHVTVNEWAWLQNLEATGFTLSSVEVSAHPLSPRWLHSNLLLHYMDTEREDEPGERVEEKTSLTQENQTHKLKPTLSNIFQDDSSLTPSPWTGVVESHLSNHN